MKENLPKNTDENGRDENGRFRHGNTGKPKGAANKTTKDLRQFITGFLNDKAFEIMQIWDTLDDKDKATFFLHLARLVLPKPPEEKEMKNDFVNIDVRILTTEEIKELLNEEN